MIRNERTCSGSPGQGPGVAVSAACSRARRRVWLLWLCAASVATPAVAQESPRAALDGAVRDFFAGNIAAAVAGFDRVVELDPESMPYLWQRGIALYYAERWTDCREQFEAHRTVNPNDVENPVWHFLCVARQESPERARELILPVGPDARSPMDEVYSMFLGRTEPEQVLAAAGESVSARFYAELYVGLYYEALGEPERALRHIRAAAASRYARPGSYMHRVAQVHLLERER